MPGPTTGSYVPTRGPFTAFVPDPLPRSMDFNPEIVELLERASASLGALQAVGSFASTRALIPLATGPALRREVVASCRIEGIDVALGALLALEASPARAGVPPDVRAATRLLDVQMAATDHPRAQPVTETWVRGLHGRLFGPETRRVSAGEYRTAQVYVGNRYIPPPAETVATLMDDLLAFVADPPPNIPRLIHIGMVHYQFEAIHPFFDGNGRMGRLLILVLLARRGLLASPLLSLSEILDARRREYYDALLAVSRDGDWQRWIGCFLRAVEQQAGRDTLRVERLLLHREKLRERYAAARRRTSRDIIDLLIERPVISAGVVKRGLRCSPTTAQSTIDALVTDGVLRETTGYARNRIYIADAIMDIVMPRS